MNSIFLSAISLSGYCGFLLEPHTEGVEENARTWAAVTAVRHPHSLPGNVRKTGNISSYRNRAHYK